MAIFGAPVPQADHATRACTVALDMVTELEEINKRRLAGGELLLRVGIGVNTGEMTVGNIGSKRRFDYTVIGDAVNLGARLEGLNKYFGTNVLVSEFTQAECDPNRFVFREVGDVRVKGKDRPVTVYELLTSGKKRDTVAAFLDPYERGLEALRSKKFEEARAEFEAAIKAKSDDGPANYYLTRCNVYIEEPAMYSPILTMESK